jgi:hypothetical protein
LLNVESGEPRGPDLLGLIASAKGWFAVEIQKNKPMAGRIVPYTQSIVSTI